MNPSFESKDDRNPGPERKHQLSISRYTSLVREMLHYVKTLVTTKNTKVEYQKMYFCAYIHYSSEDHFSSFDSDEVNQHAAPIVKLLRGYIIDPCLEACYKQFKSNVGSSGNAALLAHVLYKSEHSRTKSGGIISLPDMQSEIPEACVNIIKYNPKEATSLTDTNNITTKYNVKDFNPEYLPHDIQLLLPFPLCPFFEEVRTDPKSWTRLWGGIVCDPNVCAMIFHVDDTRMNTFTKIWTCLKNSCNYSDISDHASECRDALSIYAMLTSNSLLAREFLSKCNSWFAQTNEHFSAQSIDDATLKLEMQLRGVRWIRFFMWALSPRVRQDFLSNAMPRGMVGDAPSVGMCCDAKYNVVVTMLHADKPVTVQFAFQIGTLNCVAVDARCTRPTALVSFQIDRRARSFESQKPYLSPGEFLLLDAEAVRPSQKSNECDLTNVTMETATIQSVTYEVSKQETRGFGHVRDKSETFKLCVSRVAPLTDEPLIEANADISTVVNQLIVADLARVPYILLRLPSARYDPVVFVNKENPVQSFVDFMNQITDESDISHGSIASAAHYFRPRYRDVHASIATHSENEHALFDPDTSLAEKPTGMQRLTVIIEAYRLHLRTQLSQSERVVHMYQVLSENDCREPSAVGERSDGRDADLLIVLGNETDKFRCVSSDDVDTIMVPFGQISDQLCA